VPAKDLQRSVRTRVIIGDYRIYVLADIVQCISENTRFIANAGDSDQKVPLPGSTLLWPNLVIAYAALGVPRSDASRELMVTLRFSLRSLRLRANPG
jgi:hypothetical protein